MFKTEKNGDNYTTCRVQWVGIYTHIGVTAAQCFSKGYKRPYHALRPTNPSSHVMLDFKASSAK